jgi:predicted TPR repeat methyltransferase
MTEVGSTALAAAFGAKDAVELEARYAEWADTYDSENAAAGYRNPQLCAAFLARYVARNAYPILDAGCGTGLAGDCLHVLGYRGLVGIDLSKPMLARAEGLGVYNHLLTMTLGEPLDFPDAHFAAVIAAGVFTEGHAPHSSFDGLIRVTRPGGHLVFNVRDDVYEQQGFRERQEALEAMGRWILRERTEPYRPFTIRERNLRARIFVYEVPGAGGGAEPTAR